MKTKNGAYVLGLRYLSFLGLVSLSLVGRLEADIRQDFRFRWYANSVRIDGSSPVQGCGPCNFVLTCDTPKCWYPTASKCIGSGCTTNTDCSPSAPGSATTPLWSDPTGVLGYPGAHGCLFYATNYQCTTGGTDGPGTIPATPTYLWVTCNVMNDTVPPGYQEVLTSDATGFFQKRVIPADVGQVENHLVASAANLNSIKSLSDLPDAPSAVDLPTNRGASTVVPTDFAQTAALLDTMDQTSETLPPTEVPSVPGGTTVTTEPLGVSATTMNILVGGNPNCYWRNGRPDTPEYLNYANPPRSSEDSPSIPIPKWTLGPRGSCN